MSVDLSVTLPSAGQISTVRFYRNRVQIGEADTVPPDYDTATFTDATGLEADTYYGYTASYYAHSDGMVSIRSRTTNILIEAFDPPPKTLQIELACRDSPEQYLWSHSVDLTVDPGPIAAGEPFTADIQSTLRLDQAFLQRWADVNGLFHYVTVETIELEMAQVGIGVSGAAGADVLSVYPFPTPATLNVPIVPGTEYAIPTQVAGDLPIPLTPVVGSYTAGPPGSRVDFAPTGITPANVLYDDPPIDTYAQVVLGYLAVAFNFACQSGHVNDNGTPADQTDDFIDPPTTANVVSFTVPGGGVCGNGVVEVFEDCDDGGETATCDPDCSFAACGDGTINTTAGEQCDDWNTRSGDPCDENCQFDYCFDDPGTPGVDPADCSDGNECTADECTTGIHPVTGNPAAICSNPDLVAGTRCHSNPSPDEAVGACDGSGVCDDCLSLCQPPGGQTVTVACLEVFKTDRLWELPLHLWVATDPDPIQANEIFEIEVYATIALPQAFLSEETNYHWELGSLVESADLFNVQVELALEGATTYGPNPVPWVRNRFAIPHVGNPLMVVFPLPLVPGTEGTGPPQIAGDLLIPLRVASSGLPATAGPAGTLDLVPKGDAYNPDIYANEDTYVEVRMRRNLKFICEAGTVNDNGTPADPSDDFIDPPTAADIVSLPIE